MGVRLILKPKQCSALTNVKYIILLLNDHRTCALISVRSCSSVPLSCGSGHEWGLIGTYLKISSEWPHVHVDRVGQSSNE